MFALGEKQNPGNTNSKMVRRRRSVLLLLALTVLSPLALYTILLSAVLSSIQARGFPGEITSQGLGIKADKLNALTLETVCSLKEPVGIIFPEERGKLAKESSESKSQELPLRKEGNHKDCVLSEVRVAADGSGFKDGEVIEQVTTREGQDGDSASSVTDEQAKTSGLQQQSSSEVDTLRLMISNPFLNLPRFS